MHSLSQVINTLTEIHQFICFYFVISISGIKAFMVEEERNRNSLNTLLVISKTIDIHVLWLATSIVGIITTVQLHILHKRYFKSLHQNTIITSGVIATKFFLVVLDILLLLQVKSRCDSNLKIGKLLQQHKFVVITYNSSLH